MRRGVYISAGLLAAATAAPAAHAADAITLTLGGRISEFFVVASQAQAAGEDLNSTSMFNDTRISVEGKTVLDNGISVRAFVRFNAVARDARDVDEAYVDVVTSFGRLRAGEKAGLNTTTIGDPVPEAFVTVDQEILGDALSPRTGIVLRDAFTFKRFTGNALGVSYQTPEISGFKVGVAYHPAPATLAGPLDNRLVPNNALDITGGYEGDFSGGTYRFAGGYFHMNSRTGASGVGADGVQAWNLSAGATYGGFEVDAAYMNILPDNGTNEQAWTVGALYGIGPFQVSADYRSAKRKPFRFAPMKEQVDRATLQTAYKLGPGISVGLAGFYAEQKDTTGKDWDGGGVLGGVKIGF